MPERASVLLVEDREEDVLLIQKAFEEADIRNPLFVVRSGDEAIKYLAGLGKYSDRTESPLPELVLLDLKMPGQDGFEVLRWVRSQPGLRSLRIIVLTASENIRDANQAYRLGANSFLVKPKDFENTVELSKVLGRYWLHLSMTPENSRPPETAPQLDKPSILPQ
jgi:CheY-like chemotaxis protein